MYKALQINKWENTKKRWSTYFFVFLILYISNDTFLFGTNRSFLMVSFSRWFSLACIFMLLILVILKGKIYPRRNNSFIFLLCFVICQLANYILGGSTLQIVMVQLVFILFAFLVVQIIDYRVYFDVYTDVMTVFAVSSIVIYLLNIFVPEILRAFPVVVNTSGTSVNHLLLGVADTSPGTLMRSRGIFWEPGTYAIYLVLAIMYEIYSHTFNVKKLVILIIALVLTFSTAGYISCAYLVLVWIISRNVNSRLKTNVFLLLLGALLIFSPFLSVVFEEMFVNKLAGGILTNTNGSTVARVASFVINGEIALENPLFGVGLTDINNIFIEKSIDFFGYINRTNANANTVMFKFAAHGLLYGALVVLGIWKLFCNITKARGTLVKSLWLMFVFILFAGENLQNSILPYMLIFYGITLDHGYFENAN